jgi:hypothetical protein
LPEHHNPRGYVPNTPGHGVSMVQGTE